MPLYSVSTHPLNTHEFCVCGRDHVIRVYDQRKCGTNEPAPLYKCYPKKVSDFNNIPIQNTVFLFIFIRKIMMLSVFTLPVRYTITMALRYSLPTMTMTFTFSILLLRPVLSCTNIRDTETGPPSRGSAISAPIPSLSSVGRIAVMCIFGKKTPRLSCNGCWRMIMEWYKKNVN